IAAITSFGYAFIALGLSIAKFASDPHYKGSLKLGMAGGDLSSSVRVWQVFQALGNIAFAYSYSMVLLEIEDTLKTPPPESKTMRRVTISAIDDSLFLYLPRMHGLRCLWKWCSREYSDCIFWPILDRRYRQHSHNCAFGYCLSGVCSAYLCRLREMAHVTLLDNSSLQQSILHEVSIHQLHHSLHALQNSVADDPSHLQRHPRPSRCHVLLAPHGPFPREHVYETGEDKERKSYLDVLARLELLLPSRHPNGRYWLRG
ncbi:Amino acid permease 5-like protein, partial [Drosera capensis]